MYASNITAGYVFTLPATDDGGTVDVMAVAGPTSLDEWAGTYAVPCVGVRDGEFRTPVLNGSWLDDATVATEEWHEVASRAQRAVLTATTELVRQGRQEATRDFDAWKEAITDAAIEYADENSLCSRFDEFMESNGLRGRNVEHTVTLRIPVTARRGDPEAVLAGVEEIASYTASLIAYVRDTAGSLVIEDEDGDEIYSR